MSKTVCSFEKEVERAVRLGEWTEMARNHLASCQDCSETVRIAGWMRLFSEQEKPRELPGHRLIWLKAQYAQKQERLSKFDLILVGGLWLIGLAILAGILHWQFPHLFSAIAEMSAKSFPRFGNLLSRGISLTIAALILITVWALTRDRSAVNR